MAKFRLTKHYQTAAVLLLNTLVLTAVVLAVLHFVFPMESSIWNQNLEGRRLSEDLVPEHYYLSDPEETDEIRRTLDDYILQGHWQVHPWTGLINREYTSRHLNIDADGRRATRAPDAGFSHLPPLTVWVFGGSTLFGWGVGDDTTIPSHLQAALQKLSQEHQVRVSNFGVPWYNSSHQVALLTAHLRRAAPPPDMIVFLDGLNDLIHKIHYRTESPLHHQLDKAWEVRLDGLFAAPPWIRLTPSFPLFRAAQSLGRSHNPTLGGLVGDEIQGDPEALIGKAADDYLTNQRIAASICDELGVAPYFFLQPVPMWLNETRDQTVDANYNAFAERVLAQRGAHLHDLRGGLAGLDERYAMTVERVGVHYSDVAGRVLARAMAEVILSPPLSAPAPSANDRPTRSRR